MTSVHGLEGGEEGTYGNTPKPRHSPSSSIVSEKLTSESVPYGSIHSKEDRLENEVLNLDFTQQKPGLETEGTLMTQINEVMSDDLS